MNAPIGLFDSGIGGTSIWREVTTLLPNEDTIYLSDSINAPYGEKSSAEIIEFSFKNADLLLQKGCKLIIVACNTATTNAINILRETYDIPFIGIEPAIKPAALKTDTGSIGILATKGTLSSSLFSKTSKQFTSNSIVTEQIGTGLVQLIESGKLNSDEMTCLLHKYLHPMLINNIDHLVLGCTHYPYLIPQIQKIVGPNVKIIDSGLAVAKQTKVVLTKYNLLNTGSLPRTHQFYTNKNIPVLEELLKGVRPNYSIEKLDF